MGTKARIFVISFVMGLMAPIFGSSPVALGDEDATNAPSEGTTSEGSTSEEEESTSAAPIKDYDDQLYDIGKEIPEFAGVWIEKETDTLVIGATEPSQEIAIAAKAALVPVLSPIRQSKLRADPATYSFVQLYDWHQSILQHVLKADEIPMSYIDHERNRIIVGVDDLALRAAQAEAEVIGQGIPREVIILEEIGALTPDSSLTSNHRPVINGLATRFKRSDGSWGECTIGLVARRLSTDARGTITNSHCSERRGDGADGSRYYQYFITNANYIGKETVDPYFFTGGVCPADHRCRYSDANFAKFDAGVDFKRGHIVRPNTDGSWNGSTIYEVVARLDELPQGETVWKVGRTTFQTSGEILSACTFFIVADMMYRCQGRADYHALAGDSGSPVFRRYFEFGFGFAEVAGIHWIRDAENNPFFSKIHFIEHEIGDIRICRAGLTC